MTHIIVMICCSMCTYIYISEWGICPYGICCPWVRGGWDLDALGKFFRRRRRRRPRPLLFRQFLEQVIIFSHFSWKTDLWGHLFLRRSFFKNEFSPKAAPPSFSAFISEKICIFYQQVIIFCQKVIIFVKNWHFWSKTNILRHFFF